VLIPSNIPQTRKIRAIQLILTVKYPHEYPEVVPELAIHASKGSINEMEEETLLNALRNSGEESIGMAMVFTLVSQLQDYLRILVDDRVELRKQEAADKARREVEAEEARTKGTPVTPATFAGWKKRFAKDMATTLVAEEEERIKAMSPKEREEYKKNKVKPTGRQLFERDRNFGADDEEGEEGASVDISQYERRETHEEEEEEENIRFSDSD